MSHDARFDFEYESTERALLIFRSVEQEIGKIDDERSRTTVKMDGCTVVIHVSADDLVALRAAMNTWQTLAGVAERVSAVGDSSPIGQ
ncbi:KEOPS complex subunit Pcc1 [Haladaptatus caseinilyticus]|uniref:KEOPS complex subunit Pcc1 n=1 Tax=Haladaptatus caseinilyticus TaxID=2993314 RepID=UPI00224A4D1D|nr:KEOPS complex subunit Pcc1 [Haladaptatus caseinilyticus]